MVYRRRSSTRLRRKQTRKRMPRHRYARRPRHQIFSETFLAAPLVVTSDGISAPVSAQPFAAAMDSVSQFKAYKALYQKYRILKLEWHVIPAFGQSEPNQAEYNVGSSGTFQRNGVVHIVKDWSGASSPTPANETEMLQSQGVRTRMLNGRPFKVVQKYPSTLVDYEVNDLSGGVPTTFLSGNVKNIWCSFDDPVVYNHGFTYLYTVVAPGGNLASIGQTVGRVYCKMTFAVADPR